MSFTTVPSVVTGQTYSAANYNTYLKDNINFLKDEVDAIKLSYLPVRVGSLYFTTEAGNPATLLGYGTWAAFGAGRVIVGYDATQTEFDTIEETGGEKTHALTADENGPHIHSYIRDTGLQNVESGAQSARYPSGGGDGTGSSGLGDPHNNLQPYIVAYVWKRTA